MFSFFTRGMSFVDMVYLRSSDIHDGVLTYARHKTGQMLSMRIEPQLQHIIDRYSNASPYILPILAKDDSYDNYRQQQRELNKFIRKIGVLLNIPEPLTFYVARHSWAALARNLRHTAHGDPAPGWDTSNGRRASISHNSTTTSSTKPIEKSSTCSKRRFRIISGFFGWDERKQAIKKSRPIITNNVS